MFSLHLIGDHMAKAIVRLEEGYRTRIQARDHVWYADEPESDGGADSGPMPTEMLRGALGACVVITLKKYAERKKWPLEGIEVMVDYERFNAADYPAYQGDEPYVHEFREQIVLHGPLSEEQRTRLLEIASKCPVRRAISSPAFFFEELLETESLPSE
jgi:putative redox protein